MVGTFSNWQAGSLGGGWFCIAAWPQLQPMSGVSTEVGLDAIPRCLGGSGGGVVV